MHVHTVVMDRKEFKTFSKLVPRYLLRVQVLMLSVPLDLVALQVDSVDHLVVCVPVQLASNWLLMAPTVMISTNVLLIMVDVLIAAQILLDLFNVLAQKIHRYKRAVRMKFNII